MKIKPIGNRLVLKSLKKQEKTISGIIIPESSKETPVFAEVIEISKDLENLNDIKLGDRVLYTKYKATIVKEKEEEYIVIDKEDILAIIEE
ncbi:co-chaperone GroES [Helcococcus ovis]|uniref:Co-chaperonin GroES n=1 Tax=Helcococcus ovis TaxID=72026 RepID=A0A4R9C4L4_9FIRM|nr:co-chaperone GroES [Helcococcus ovis]TFF65888.1 co-chaperone GroES [Helcococcus ovis]TFF67351.1 co-chaperone GroES [Helcococcus ovis]TFF67590.1 co-chaperone GroES [Helcococcus ovis]WNZ00990.1 co-chaperone GroES [Helcococcus ovis]